MTSYTTVFGGSTIYPSEINYSAVALSADVTLSWPEETSTSENLATRIIDVTPSEAGKAITLPDARKSGTGNTVLFNNLGAHSFTVKDADGVQTVVIESGELWQVYLTDNTTEAGEWQTLQYGSTVSVANASALAGTGIIATGALLSQSVPVTPLTTNYTVTSVDRAKMFNWTGESGGTVTLPPAATVGNNWFIYIRNSGAATVVARSSENTVSVDGQMSISFQPGESAIIACDGVNYYSIGYGQPGIFAFDYTEIDISGSGSYTLTGREQNRIAYNFSGTLTGDRTIIVPRTVQQYWVNNTTTGGYTVSMGTGIGDEVTLSSGQRTILYCDSINMLLADTAGIGVPIAIGEGGTGATTASGARTSLGATSVGNALFTAASQAAAWTALGRAPSGTVDGGTF